MGERNKNLTDKAWNILDKSLFWIKYANKLPTYLTEQDNAVKNQLE